MQEKYRLRIRNAAAKAVVDQSIYYELRENIQLAQRWDAAIDTLIDSLRLLPERGAPCHFTGSALHSIRRIPVPGFSQHLLFYRVIKEEGILQVLHVLHGARDIEAALRTSLRET